MKFSWDEKKEEENFKNHGVAFEVAQELFFDPNAIDFFDSEHSTSELIDNETFIDAVAKRVRRKIPSGRTARL